MPDRDLGERARLEALLRYTQDGGKAVALAESLIGEYGSAAAVMESEPEDIARMSGMTLRSAQLLSLTPGLSRRYLRDQFEKTPVLDTLQKTSEYAATLFLGARYEQFYMLCLDKSFRLIACQMMQRGSLTETPFYPRQIAELALRTGAFSVVLAHNHPGGTDGFSVEDVRSTKDGIAILQSIGVVMLDHLLYAKRKVYSIRSFHLVDQDQWYERASAKGMAEKWFSGNAPR